IPIRAGCWRGDVAGGRDGRAAAGGRAAHEVVQHLGGPPGTAATPEGSGDRAFPAEGAARTPPRGVFAAGELDATVDRHPGGNPGPLRPGGAAPAPDPSRAPGEATRDSRPPLPQDGTLQSDGDRKSTRLNSSHVAISYAVFCLKKKTN